MSADTVKKKKHPYFTIMTNKHMEWDISSQNHLNEKDSKKLTRTHLLTLWIEMSKASYFVYTFLQKIKIKKSK